MTNIAQVRADVRSRLAMQIRLLRAMRGWSVAELAKRAGVEAAVLAHLESAHVIDIGIDELHDIAEALGVDVSILFTRPTAQ